jgi:hypothetical protein
MDKQGKSVIVSRILALVAVAAVLLAAAVAVDSATAGKPQVGLSYQLYSSVDGTFVVDYTVPSKGAGNIDLAVSHECFSDGQLVQEWTNRLYWSGKGADKAGHWNIPVQGGNECFAAVVDLGQPASGALSLTTSGYAQVSPVVHYVVQ